MPALKSQTVFLKNVGSRSDTDLAPAKQAGAGFLNERWDSYAPGQQHQWGLGPGFRGRNLKLFHSRMEGCALHPKAC